MRTLTLPEKNTHHTTNGIQEEIQEQVDERGFYLYEWISPDELRMSIQSDYLQMVKKSSIPLAIIATIVGFMGLAGGFLGVFLAVLSVLSIFYAIVLFLLIVLMVRKAYLYTRGADVVITDNHYITGGKVLKKDDFSGQSEAFDAIGTLFREPVFQSSQLADYVELEKKNLFDQLKEIMLGGGRLAKNMGKSRDSGSLIIALFIIGILYGAMMGGVYFLGVFFVAILARIFSYIAHKALLATRNTEHTIQNLFSEITDASTALKEEKKQSMYLLQEAGENEWKENLTSKITESFNAINQSAKNATEKSSILSHLLKKSKYSDIFNFGKYNSWLKSQVLSPIEEVIALLEKNRTSLEKSESLLKETIHQTKNISGKKALELQQERILLQIENFKKTESILGIYRDNLTQ